jgi:hypothetical protein
MYAPQRIQSRFGLSAYAGPFGGLPLHSVRQLNDRVLGIGTRVIGAGTNLYMSFSSTPVDTGYSGNPLSLIPFRPSQSPESWMYVGDASRMRKVLANGTNYAMGIAPPLQPPQAEFGTPAVTSIDDFNSVGSWTPGGTAGALSIINKMTTDVVFMVFDTPPVAGVGTGWAELVLASVLSYPNAAFGSLAGGDRITVAQGAVSEVALIQEVIPPAWDPNMYVNGANPGITIAAIAYDSGTTGPCTITLSVPQTCVQANLGYVPAMDLPSSAATGPTSLSRHGTNNPVGLRPNSALILNYGVFGGGTETVRVLSVSSNGAGLISFRCVTVNTHAVGNPVVSTACIRLYLANNYSGAGGLGIPSTTMSITQNALQSTIAAGLGTISEVKELNLGIFAGQDLPVQENSRIHLGFLIDNAVNLVEVRLIFDIDSSDNDFQHTYFFKSFGPADIQQALAGNTTMQQGRETAYSGVVTNANIGAVPEARSVGPALVLPPVLRGDPAQIAASQGGNVPTLFKASPIGLARWMNLHCLVSDLTKVGTDSSATLSNVQGVRIQISVAQQSVCAVAALHLSGGYGPDIGDTGVPYLYRYQPRSSFTGAKGYPSPPTRSGISPQAQIIEVDCVQHPDPQVDTLDVYRWGGTLPNWTYVGSVPNTSVPVFLDVYSDTALQSSPQLAFDNLQPFPTIDTPKSGRVNVSGTTVTWASGDQFNPSWAQGTQINIGGIFYTFYMQPSSPTQVQIVENAGTQTNVPYTIAEATILGQPLPVLWGPYSQGTALYLFACGDLYQPGVLFLTNGNDPDSASDVLQIEITPPSEPLMNGCMYSGQAYVWSSDRLFFLYPSFGSSIVVEAGSLLPAEGTNLFVPLEVPDGKGLFARYCLAVGPKMWFRARDGIYETTGGEPTNITWGELGLLFPHDGQPGVPLTVGTFTIYPPDDTQPSAQRLAYYNSHLYFDYIDTQGNRTTLVANTATSPYVWSKDDYTPQILVHYGQEGQAGPTGGALNNLFLGGADGVLYQAFGDVDGTGHAFSFEARMPQMSELVGGFQHVRDGYLGLIEVAVANLVVNVDGVDNLVALPSVSGAYRRVYTPLPALKGRLYNWALIGTSPFAMVQRDCQVSMRSWGDDGAYTPINPFSSMTRAQQSKVT